MSVVLPAPFGPSTACNSPSGTAMSTSSVATMPQNRLARRSTSSSASAIALLPALHEVRERAQEADNAAAREQHDHEQERPEHDLPVFAGHGGVRRIERTHRRADDGGLELLPETPRQRADQRPEQAAHAPEP